MALHLTPEDHVADPPSGWIIKKAGRRWALSSPINGGVFDYFDTKRAAQAAKTAGFLVSLYEKEGRWFAGEPIANWKPYKRTTAVCPVFRSITGNAP